MNDKTLSLHVHNDIKEAAKWFKIPLAHILDGYVYVMQENRCVFIGNIKSASNFINYQSGKRHESVYPLGHKAGN